MSNKLILMVVKTESFLLFKAKVKLVLHGVNISYLGMLSICSISIIAFSLLIYCYFTKSNISNLQ